MFARSVVLISFYRDEFLIAEAVSTGALGTERWIVAQVWCFQGLKLDTDL